MKQLLLTLTLILTTFATAAATNQPAIIFTQEVIAINADGSRIPSVKIEPQSMAGMQRHDFDLGRKRLLRIETNIRHAEQRGLDDLANTIKRCYSYIEATTGRSLERGVLLYLIELDDIPYAYNFSASYNDASQWGEVRLAMLEQGADLSGPEAPTSLTDLLYDTLPHELGHDVLEGLPQLAHDIDGKPSQHTRWFIEGVCEVLAKGFSQQEAPALHKQFLASRKIDSVLAKETMKQAMLTWAQQNDNGLVYESDLYGAAMLTMMAWTERISLDRIIAQVTSHDRSVRGRELLAMMKSSTGYGPQEMMALGHSHGGWLKDKVLLAQLD